MEYDELVDWTIVGIYELPTQACYLNVRSIAC
jgi:hypothetical protein